MICISIYRQCLTILVGIETKTRVMSTAVAVKVTHDCEAFPFVNVRMHRHIVRPYPPRHNSTAQKSDRVPSEVMLRSAQTRIQDWWAQAYDGVLGERFRLEAQASLPLVGGGAGVEEVYAGVRVQRLRLRFDLGVGEWR